MQPFKRHLGPTAPSPGYQSRKSNGSQSPALSRAESPIAFSSTQSSKLFDPKRNFYPHPHLLNHLLEVFFDKLHCQFPFFRRTDIMRRLKTGNLPAVLADAMVGLSSRYSDAPELAGARYAAGEPFIQAAKVCTHIILLVSQH
jgi:hypothetical protein